jgi:hypothetical protein
LEVIGEFIIEEVVVVWVIRRCKAAMVAGAAALLLQLELQRSLRLGFCGLEGCFGT